MKTTKMITKEMEALFKKHGLQDGKGDQAIVIAKFFHCRSRYTFFVTEMPYEGTFFGYTVNMAQEWGNTDIAEMEAVRVNGLPIERDLYWKPITLAEALKEHGITYQPGRQV